MGSSDVYCKLGTGVVRCTCECAPNDEGCGKCSVWFYYFFGIVGGILLLLFLYCLITSYC